MNCHSLIAGIDIETVDYIRRGHYNQMLRDCHNKHYTYGEVLLLYWEYFDGMEVPGLNLLPCSLDNLIECLEKIHRFDVADKCRRGRKEHEC